jgi:CDP-glycerol glycerophosphotransferase
LLAPGALAAIAGQIAANQPDVLLIGYQELSGDGSARDGYGRELLRAAPAGVFTLADEPALINLTMTAWSKVLRREFLAGLGVRFPAGIHEDIPVTCAALLAGRLAVLDRTCYLYRRRRPGAFLVTPGAAHLAVFESYGQVFGLLARQESGGDPLATAAVRAAIFERAIWHYAAVFAARGRSGRLGWRPHLVPRRERRAFFARMRAEFVRRRPAGYQLPPGTRGAKLRLIERGAYRTWCLAEPVNQARVAVRDAIAARRTGHHHDHGNNCSNSEH